MPIFVSRFSPERSLIGSFVAPGSRRNETPEQVATERPASAASSGNSLQGADRTASTRDLTSPVSVEQSPARSASVTVSEQLSLADVPESSESVGSLTLLDQLRLRRNGANPIQETPSNQPPEAADVAADPTPAPSAVGAESPLADRLRALTAELASDRGEVPVSEADPVVVEDLAAENQTANAVAAEEDLDSLIAALQDEGVDQEAVPVLAPSVPVIDTEAITEAITLQEETVVSRDSQEQTLRDGLQTIASGLRGDAAIESRQNVEATARNAAAASDVQSRREVQQNQREIQSLQADRRAAQQDARSADQAIRQLQSRNTRAQTESTQPAGTSLDVLAQ